MTGRYRKGDLSQVFTEPGVFWVGSPYKDGARIKTFGGSEKASSLLHQTRRGILFTWSSKGY